MVPLPQNHCLNIKGQGHEIFCFRFFFTNHLPTSPENNKITLGRFEFFLNHGDFCKSRCTIGIKGNPAAYFPPISNKYETDNKFGTGTTGVVDTGGK
jgi:hypothetical protein